MTREKTISRSRILEESSAQPRMRDFEQIRVEHEKRKIDVRMCLDIKFSQSSMEGAMNMVTSA